MAQPYEFSCFEDKHGEEARRAEEIAMEQEIASAQSAAHKQGFEAGLLEAKTRSEARIARAAEKIHQELVTLTAKQSEFQLGLEQRASELALLISRKLASALIAQQPEQELLAMIRDCLSRSRDESKVVIQVSEKLVDALKEVLDKIQLEERFEGDLILLADPELAEGDCRIEWADGGAERKQADIEQAIDQVVGAYLLGNDSRSRAAGNDQTEEQNTMSGDAILPSPEGTATAATE